MPAPRDLAADLARNIAELFGDAETRLAAALARQVRADIQAEYADRLAGLAKVRAAAQAILARLDSRSHDAAARAVMRGFAAGAADAVDELTRLGSDRGRDWAARRSRIVRAISRLTGIARRRDMRLQEELGELRTALPGIDAMMALIQELTQRLSSTHLRVMRWEQDAYRRALASPALDVLAGTKTRLRATQVVMDDLFSQGITGFTDKAGRDWTLGAYAEMATRTTVAHATIEGHLSQLRADGVDLVMVSNSPEECSICRRFEGRVLAIAGPAGPRIVEHGLDDGRMIPVDVYATVGDAIAAGLFHPNCTHRLVMYTPGVTRVPTDTANPQGYEDRQELRRLERETRKAKRRAAAALTPEARAAAERRVRARQAQIRRHVDATGQFRRRDREQLEHDSPEAPPPPVQGPIRPRPTPQPAPARTPEPTAPAPTPAPPVQPELPAPVDLGDLAARSDDDLFGLFNEHADRPDVLETILAELERRDAEPDPVDPLEGVVLENIGRGWLDYYEREHADNPSVVERVQAERDRRAEALRRREAAAAAELERDRAPRPAPAPPEDLTPEQRRVEELVDAGRSWQAAYAEVYDVDDTDLDRQDRVAAIDADRALGETREDTIRRLYREYVAVQYLAAEEATRGHMLNLEGRNNDIDPTSLFSGNAARARKYASGDLLEWFDEHGRMTYTQFRTEILGRARPTTRRGT